MKEMDEVSVLRARLERLERSHTRLKRFSACALLAVSGLISTAAMQGPAPVVDAREFRVVDAEGKVRATLGPSEFRWGGIDDGPFSTATTALRLNDQYQQPHVVLQAVWDPRSDQQAGGTLTVSGGRDRPTLSVGADGRAATITLLNEDGNWVALGGQTQHGLTVRDGLKTDHGISVGGGAGFEATDGKMTFYDRAGRTTSTVP